jgi:peptidoglycan hydrolase CwlO-like protein
MKRNIFAAILLFIGTSILWLVVCWNIWGKVHANNTTTEIQKQDSVINYNAGEYDRLLQEQIELYKQLRTYEDAQLTTKTTYRTRRDTILRIDTIRKIDIVYLVNACDSVIASDSLVIDNLKGQLNIEEEKINNLQETKVAFEQKTNVLQEEINTLNAENKKLNKQKKRRNHALVVTSTVAILSTFVLSILL